MFAALELIEIRKERVEAAERLALMDAEIVRLESELMKRLR